MRELPYYNSFFKSAHPPAIELAQLLDELTPKQFHRVFFTQSGSEANDTILRMARRYWDLMGQPKRKVVISRINAYHGSTMAAASLGGMAAMHAQGGLPIPDIVAHRAAVLVRERHRPLAARNTACAPRGASPRRSRRSARSASPPSSASRCRARAA